MAEDRDGAALSREDGGGSAQRTCSRQTRFSAMVRSARRDDLRTRMAAEPRNARVLCLGDRDRCAFSSSTGLANRRYLALSPRASVSRLRNGAKLKLAFLASYSELSTSRTRRSSSAWHGRGTQRAPQSVRIQNGLERITCSITIDRPRVFHPAWAQGCRNSPRQQVSSYSGHSGCGANAVEGSP